MLTTCARSAAGPSTPYAPIQEIIKERNLSIKQHYWKLWSLGGAAEADVDSSISSLKITDEFVGEEVVISAEDIESFCRVVGNESEVYKSTNNKDGVQVPMDFAIKLGWKVCCGSFH